MSTKPILFNTEMVRANLDGRKSCTRRLVKGFVPDDAIWGYTAILHQKGIYHAAEHLQMVTERNSLNCHIRLEISCMSGKHGAKD